MKLTSTGWYLLAATLEPSLILPNPFYRARFRITSLSLIAIAFVCLDAVNARFPISARKIDFRKIAEARNSLREGR